MHNKVSMRGLAMPFVSARLFGIVLPAIAVFLSMVSVATAHPGSGIAVDRNRNLFFADVANTIIWKVDANGKRTPFVTDSWTHGIQLDADGTLYFERELEVAGVAPCELNRITPEGKRENIIPAAKNRADFSGAPFVRLRNGDVLFAHSIRGEDGEGRALIGRRDVQGRVSTWAGAKQGPLYVDGEAPRATFRMITDMKLGPDGKIYLLDRDRLRRVALDGTTETLARNLLDKAPKNPPQKTGPPTTINRLYGLAIEADKGVFIAYHAGRRVIRVSPAGEVSTVLSAKDPWAPVGVALADGNLYILEAHDNLRTAGPRVRRMTEDGRLSVFTVVGE